MYCHIENIDVCLESQLDPTFSTSQQTRDIEYLVCAGITFFAKYGPYCKITYNAGCN